MNIPNYLQYTEDHEWIKIDNGIATVGITDYAQSELGDIIFIELPDIGVLCNKKDSIGTIEAVKTVADIFSPVSGEISKINTNLEDRPESVNSDPYGNGWIVQLSNINLNDNSFLSAEEYKELIQ